MSAPPGFWHPAGLIATWFGSGLLPRAPGTWGSLAALPPAAGIAAWSGPWGLLAAAAALTLLGVWAAGVFAARLGEPDPGRVVVDEAAGQWLALVPAALDPRLYLVGFLAFRAFDIVKPWPAGPVERRLGGGWGIMLDDTVAACYAAAAVYGVSLVLPD